VAQLQYRSNLRPLRVLLKAGPMGALSDRQLLERFVGADGDVAELAFAAIVDRHLEGLAYEEAARLLGCPVGTIKSRLARGRERLRVRMARRGVAPSPGVLVATVSESLVPSTLRDATAHAAIRFTMHGPPAVGTVSTTAAALTEGMLKTMILFRLKIAAVVVALTGLGATAVGVLTGSVVGEQLPSAPRQTARDDVSPIPVISAIRF
jgi:Sigma-70, region 4